jgi:hypothetical protein
MWESRSEPLIFYDVGANIGLNTLIMNDTREKYFPGRKYFIYAFEPEPKKFRIS